MLAAPIFRHSSYGKWHPLRIPRVSTVVDLSRALGWIDPGGYRTAPRAKAAALTGFHDPAYLATLQAAEDAQAVTAQVRAAHGLGTPSNPVFPEMWRRPATGAGGSLLAADLLAEAPGRIHNPAGGTHHGMPSRAAGFCYLNDPALAILRMRALGLSRIAYVDIDAHHPDGVAHAVRGDPGVLLISTHEEGRWPRTGALDDAGPGTWFNLPLPKGAGDADLMAALHELILPRVAAHRPDAIVLQCGADSVAEDPQAGMATGNGPHVAAVRALAGTTDRMLLLGGGGYNPWTVGRLWTAAWGALSGREMPDGLPPEAEGVLRAIRWSGSRHARDPDPRLFTTLMDPPTGGKVHPETRVRLNLLKRRL
ncbi:acetoin utilization protein AcuC [Hasllibacter halocynthiae]|uniref:Acetoin utilization protein AcuC n=1 Tax=Hasllibacter halocynthiae TaxID=595589 RepID=A0A2T0X658_9RHOB|nr:acetoin utilization protein AcuC [Hasllibacter halocynthiae]PRY94441.1 acetoin utilization protein AcuC [Hasllibacter halocynthiae]